MIDKIILGLLSVSMHVLDWFLAPLSTALSHSDVGRHILAGANQFISLCNMVDAVMLWVVDLTGIPRPLLTILGGILISCITLRLQCYVLKMVVKWWDRIIA